MASRIPMPMTTRVCVPRYHGLLSPFICISVSRLYCTLTYDHTSWGWVNRNTPSSAVHICSAHVYTYAYIETVMSSMFADITFYFHDIVLLLLLSLFVPSLCDYHYYWFHFFSSPECCRSTFLNVMYIRFYRSFFSLLLLVNMCRQWIVV